LSHKLPLITVTGMHTVEKTGRMVCTTYKPGKSKGVSSLKYELSNPERIFLFALKLGN
jgi:hypothetical protein